MITMEKYHSSTWERERYDQHLTYYGTYQIGQSITVNMKTARTVEPYIVGVHNMKEEMEHDFHMPMVDNTINTGFLPMQMTNEHLKQITMEQEITHIIEEHQQSTSTATTSGASGHSYADQTLRFLCLLTP